MDFGEIEWRGVDCIGVAQDRDQWIALVNVVMGLQVPQNAGNFFNSCKISGL
jgi:hypothetical protein